MQPETPRAAPSPVMDVVAPPPASPPAEPSASPAVAPVEPKKQAKPAPAPTKPPRQPSNGVGMAIFATVVIVLGLAALATYAYLQTAK
ncbi:MAG TPA: hypothetical protein VF401_03400 [Candidatus Saccharimonadales bacterium]